MLIHPLITEKTAKLATGGTYGFAVSADSNKIEIAREIERLYKVTVLKVRMVWTKSKARRIGRIQGKTGAFKKAYVTVKKGDKIEL